MQTHNIIQSSANVIRITSLAKGNIYKRINKKYSESYEAVYGIVQDIMNDGDNTFIEAIEYNKDYQSVSSEIKVFSGADNLSIYPASLDEVQEYFSSAIESIKRSIIEKEEELDKKRKGLDVANKLVSGELAKQLTEVSFENMTQEEFKQLNQ